MTTAVTRIVSNAIRRHVAIKHYIFLAEAGREGNTMTRSGSLMQPRGRRKENNGDRKDDIQFNVSSHVPRIATLNISNENSARQVMSGRAISPMGQQKAI